jgi:hypothetical protein
MIQQNNVIKEYENWINLLLTLVNRTKTSDGNKRDIHNDYASQIQSYLQKLTKVEQENLMLKIKLIDINRQNKLLTKKKIDIQKKKSLVEIDVSKNTDSELIIENGKLVENLQSISEELDYLCCSNKHYKQANIDVEEVYSIISLRKELTKLKIEKEKLNLISRSKDAIPLDQEMLKFNKKILKLKKNRRENSMTLYDDKSNIFSCFSGGSSEFDKEHTLFSYK